MPDLQPTDLIARAEEIYDYLASNDISQTLKRLLDFVQDFSTQDTHQQQVITLYQSFRVYNQQLQDKSLAEIKPQRDALVQEVFNIIEQIEQSWEGQNKS